MRGRLNHNHTTFATDIDAPSEHIDAVADGDAVRQREQKVRSARTRSSLDRGRKLAIEFFQVVKRGVAVLGDVNIHGEHTGYGPRDQTEVVSLKRGAPGPSRASKSSSDGGVDWADSQAPTGCLPGDLHAPRRHEQMPSGMMR